MVLILFELIAGSEPEITLIVGKTNAVDRRCTIVTGIHLSCVAIINRQSEIGKPIRAAVIGCSALW